MGSSPTFGTIKRYSLKNLNGYLFLEKTVWLFRPFFSFTKLLKIESFLIKISFILYHILVLLSIISKIILSNKSDRKQKIAAAFSINFNLHHILQDKLVCNERDKLAIRRLFRA